MKPTGSAQTRALCYTQVLKSVKRVLPLTFFVFPAVSAHAFRAFDCVLRPDGRCTSGSQPLDVSESR